jgi:hypothetical protein
MARKRNKGIESTGQDRRSADELKSEIDKLTGDEPVQAPEQAETPGPPEPAVQPTEPEPGQIDIDKLEEDLDTGLKLIHPDKPEPAPEEDKPVAPETPPAPEPELPEEVRAHGFKSVEDVYKSYNEIRRVADSERDKGRTRDEELAKIKEELAFLRGQAATSPQVAPPQPQVTKEQLDEAYQNDPIGTTNWLLQQQEARAEARINALQEKMREEQNARAIEDRQRFAVTQIPELRALHEVGGDPAKADPGAKRHAGTWLLQRPTSRSRQVRPGRDPLREGTAAQAECGQAHHGPRSARWRCLR